MAYKATGMQALFPVYLSRMAGSAEQRDSYDSAVAQNENNLNQNFELLFQKLLDLETAFAKSTEGENT